MAIQDIAAPPHICMKQISNLANYPKVVPKGLTRSVRLYIPQHFGFILRHIAYYRTTTVKKVEVYEEHNHDNVSAD